MSSASIYSGGGSISAGIDGTFPDASVETLKIGIPVAEKATMQGTDFAFASGGQSAPAPVTSIDKFPFSISSGTATDVGDLTGTRLYLAGNSSTTDGFASAGTPPNQGQSSIDKFPFSISSGTATDVGDLSATKHLVSSASSLDDAFVFGGLPNVSGADIDKFPFAISSGTATDVGDLSVAKREGTGHASTTDGFNSGGTTGSTPYSTTIDKFPFSISSGTATDVGDLSINKIGGAGHSDEENSFGFTSGGATWSPPFVLITQIDRFSFFISSGTSTDVGDLATPNNKYNIAGHASTTDGFTSGGQGGYGSPYADINKFPFSIFGNTATDVGDLSTDRYNSTGHQD